MKTTQVAVDLAKSVFEIAVSHEVGRIAEHRRLNRSGLRRFLEKQELSEILMEACGTAHYWGRECRAMGHRVRLLPAGDVRRYRDGNKTDRTDTKALLEASRNDAINAVPVKSEDQQAMAALHRIRSGFLQTRTARINAVRGHLREFGVSIPAGARNVAPFARTALEQDAVPEVLGPVLLELLDDIERLAARRLGLAQEELVNIRPEIICQNHHGAIIAYNGSGILLARPASAQAAVYPPYPPHKSSVTEASPAERCSLGCRSETQPTRLPAQQQFPVG